MSAYQVMFDGGILRVADLAIIPNDPRNIDRATYNDWIAQGNAPDPYVESPAQTAANARRIAITSDATRADLLTRLQNATPAQISSYVDANVVDLPSARALLKKMLLVMAQL